MTESDNPDSRPIHLPDSATAVVWRGRTIHLAEVESDLEAALAAMRWMTYFVENWPTAEADVPPEHAAIIAKAGGEGSNNGL